MKISRKRTIKSRNYSKSILLTLLVLFGLLITVNTFASVVYVKPNDATLSVDASDKINIPDQINSNASAKAPEPSSLAILAGGLMSMLFGFLRKTYLFAKRCFDILTCAIIFVLSIPVMLITAILIKCTSKGPIFYTQIRVGKDGKLFQMIKFRTMKVDAEKETGPVWAAKNDSRLTPIGGLLRKSRIDELPQLINVLRGEMSLIGPRPERPMFVEQLKEIIPNYEGRLAVKPGITGLAQIRHQYDETIEDVKKKLRYDLHYIKNMNMWNDLGIAVRTVRVVITGDGAR